MLCHCQLILFMLLQCTEACCHLYACSPLAVLAKIGIDQTVMAPIGTAAFFTALNLMEGLPHHILPSLKVRQPGCVVLALLQVRVMAVLQA